jgi:hypothetical protein
MTLRQSTDRYLGMHIKAFKKSFKLNRFISPFLLELAKYIFLALLLMLFLYISIRLFIAVLPLLSSLDKINTVDDFLNNESVVNIILQQSTLLSSFLINFLLLLLLIIIILSFILAIFNSLIITRLTNTHLSIKKFWKIYVVYIIVTLIYFILLFILLYLILDIILLASLLLLLTLTYSYILLVFQLSLEDISLFRYIKRGLFNCVRLHLSIPALIIGLLFLIGIFFICAIITLILKQYVVIVLLPLIALWNIWMLNYIYKILN